MTSGLQLLEKYELQECLGQGGGTDVWKAFDPRTRRLIIIRISHPDLQNNPDFMTYFWGLPLEREAQAVLSLEHLNIAPVRGFYVSLPREPGNSVPYIVMDYVEGQNLAEFMRNTSYQGVYPASADLEHFFSIITSAIGYAHEQDIIHGNLIILEEY